MQFGFKKIIDTSPLSIKNLNDQLEMLWLKVMGGINAQDILSGEKAKIIDQQADSIRLIAGEKGRVNFIRNGRGDHELSGYETRGVVNTAFDEKAYHNTILLSYAELYQYGIRMDKTKLYSFSCLARKPQNSKKCLIEVNLIGQTGPNASSRDLTVFHSENELSEEYITISGSFTTPDNITTCFLEIASNGDCLVTDIQLTRGVMPIDWVAAEEELYSSGIEVFNDKVNIQTANFNLKILDPLNPNLNEPKLTMSADSNGFDKLCAMELSVGGLTLAKYSPVIVDFYVSSFYGSDVNEGTSSLSPLKTIGEALRRLPYIGKIPVYILLQTNGRFYESIDIYSFPGEVYISSYGIDSKPKIYGKVYAENCGGLHIEGIAFQDDRPLSSSTISSYKTPLTLRHCDLVRGQSAGTSISAIKTTASNASIIGGSITGYGLGISAESGSNVNYTYGSGACTTVAKANGSVITGFATWPNYILTQTSAEYGGVVLSNGISSQVSSLDPAPASAQTSTFNPSSIHVFANNIARSDTTKMFHGVDASGTGYYSCMNFNETNIAQTLNGKNILSVRMYFLCGGFAGENTKIHLTGLVRSQNNANTPPQTVMDYGYVGIVPVSGAVWIGLPIQVGNNIASGAINSLGLYDTQYSNFFWAYGLGDSVPSKPMIEITYI